MTCAETTLNFHHRHQFSSSFNCEFNFGRGRAFLIGCWSTRANSGWRRHFVQWNYFAALRADRYAAVRCVTSPVKQRRFDISDPYENVPAGLTGEHCEDLLQPAAKQTPATAERNISNGPDLKALIYHLTKLSFERERACNFVSRSFNILNRELGFGFSNLGHGRRALATNTANPEGRRFQLR